MTAGVLLLAGGSSRRFGSDKRLHHLEDGRRLLDASIDSVARAGLPLLVCLGSRDHGLEETLRSRQIGCARCPGSGSGMGSTLADGVSRLPAHWTAVIIGLADMPFIRPDTYRAVAAALAPGRIVIPAYDGRRGHPVGFDRCYFPDLKKLAGDRGARELITASPGAVVEVVVRDPGILVDVDEPAQLVGSR